MVSSALQAGAELVLLLTGVGRDQDLGEPLLMQLAEDVAERLVVEQRLGGVGEFPPLA